MDKRNLGFVFCFDPSNFNAHFSNFHIDELFSPQGAPLSSLQVFLSWIVFTFHFILENEKTKKISQSCIWIWTTFFLPSNLSQLSFGYLLFCRVPMNVPGLFLPIICVIRRSMMLLIALGRTILHWDRESIIIG